MDLTGRGWCDAPDSDIDVACESPDSLCGNAAGDFLVTVTNSGGTLMSGVTLTVTIPPGLHLEQILDCDGWDECGSGTGTISAAENELPVGEVRLLNFTLRAEADCTGEQEVTCSATGAFIQGGCEETWIENHAGSVVVCVDPSSPPCQNASSIPGGEVPVLCRAIPNPFSSGTRISYSVEGVYQQTVVLEVFDAGGRQVRALLSEIQAPGHHEANWDGRNNQGRHVPSSIYYCRLRVGGRESANLPICLRR